ncbi:MAG: formylmethanofuran dehydrogenase subunit E family protein [Polyangiaceae bacterium]|nr:formylmethanofuran dehydrogenase subunit E family protein [Polyangiaceae bacterium]
MNLGHLLGGLIIATMVMTGGCASAPRPARDVTGSYYPDWLATAPHAPVFEVRDTVNKYGRYARETKHIDLADLIRFHGHFCGGLVEAAVSLRVAFDALFPDGAIDRTDLRVASNNSACGGDVAAYLTGARARFGTHLIDPALTESEFVLQRVSTGATVRVRIRPETYPVDVRAQMRRIEAGHAEPEELERFQALQWEYARRLVSRPPLEAVMRVDAGPYAWPEPPCRDLGRRRDNDFRGAVPGGGEEPLP